MLSGTLQSPVRIHFGPNALGHLGREAKTLGKKALIVTGRSSSTRNGTLARVRTALEAAGLTAVDFARVESDPSLSTVEAGAALARQEGCELIVALGGGSAMDAAKGIGCLLANPGPLAAYEHESPALAGPPVIAIPTTAGTGSEVTRVSVLTDTTNKRKMVLAGPTLVPTVAILDPDMTASMPPHVAAATGMDALTHAVEAYVSKLASPLSDTLALAAISGIGTHLATAVLAPDNLEARSAMLLAQMQAGQAFNTASVGLVHAMSRPMGAHCGVPHGAANAMLLPLVMAYNRPVCPERMVRIAEALGRGTGGLDADAASRLAAGAVAALAAELPLPRTLADVGVPEPLLPEMAREAVGNGSSRVNPRMASEEDVLALYRRLA